MLKKLMITTAAVAVVAGAAFAQQTPPQQTPPMNNAGSKAQVVSEQKADQWLASKFKGTDVIGTDNAKIGDVNDILFDQKGQVVAYVIGVGGFLGIGSKDVALTPASFQLQPATDRENAKLKLAMTKDELKAAAEFKPLKDRPAATTGQAPQNRAPATPPAQQTPPDQR